MDPARTFKESLTSRPELENGQGLSRRLDRTTATFGLPPATGTVSGGRQVCFGPVGDVELSYSITSPDRRPGRGSLFITSPRPASGPFRHRFQAAA
jgi:hypothetical protein